MLAGAIAGGIWGSIGVGFGNVLISIGSAAETLDSLKDIYRMILKKEQIITQNNYLSEKITDSLWERVVIDDILQHDVSEAVEWAQLDDSKKPLPKKELFDSTVELLQASRFNPLAQATVLGFSNIHFYPDHDYNSDSDNEIDDREEFGIDHSQLSLRLFFLLIKRGVQDILGIKINYRELSIKYLGMKNKWYINDRILDSIRNLDYALPTASLNKMKRNLIKNFNEKSEFFENLIKLYKSMNPWNRKIIYEQSDIDECYFDKIDTLDKAYWFGFLLAEAHIAITGGSYRFLLKLGVDDGILLKKFGNIINFDTKKINYYRELTSKGILSRKFRLSFSSELFCKNLIKNGFPKSGRVHDPSLRFPYWSLSDTSLVKAMLLGYFDGDGTLGYKYLESLSKQQKRKLNPVIASQSREFLKDIKEYFNIKNNIQDLNKGVYKLAIGRDLFQQLLENYENSLIRKRYYFF